VTRAKILLQKLWLRKLDWDESLPMQLQTFWEALKGTLLQSPKIKVSRFVHIDAKDHAEIHGFADASMRAYGACNEYISLTPKSAGNGDKRGKLE